MQAFFSGTDDANENSNQFFFVWGHVDKEEPMYAFRYVVGNTKQVCDANILFDWPMVETETKYVTNTKFAGSTDGLSELIGSTEFEDPEDEDKDIIQEEYMGPFNRIPFPDDWMTQHKKDVPTYSGYNYGKYYPGKSKWTPKTVNQVKQPSVWDDIDDDAEFPYGVWDGYGYGYGNYDSETEFPGDTPKLTQVDEVTQVISDFKTNKAELQDWLKDDILTGSEREELTKMLAELKAAIDAPSIKSSVIKHQAK